MVVSFSCIVYPRFQAYKSNCHLPSARFLGWVMDGSSDRWQLVFSLCLPRMSGTPYPTGVKSKRNHGQGFTHRGKVSTDSQARNSHRGKA